MRAIAMLLGAAVLWSTAGFLIKGVNWHPLAIAGARSGIAALVIRIAFGRIPFYLSRIQIAGAFAYTGMVVLFVTATKLTTAANAIVLQYTAPVYVALLSGWLLGEPATFKDWITVGCALGGMGLFFFDHMTAGGLLGNFCAIGAGVSLALFVICMRKQKDESPFISVFAGNMLTFVLGLPFMYGSSPGVSGWMALLLLGVFQLGVSYVLYSVAIKQVTALEATLMTIVEPLLNPVWVFFMLGELPGPWAITGGLVIIAAITGKYIVQATRQTYSQ